jgi:DNA-binding response OmpR family regulator
MANILIVEDQADLAFLVSTCLSADGHTVQTVFSKAALYECIALFRPELIILDVLLGEDNGREICEQLKLSEWRHIPVILYSSIAAHLEGYEAVGASARLLKPFTFKTLSAIVNKVLAMTGSAA